MFLFRLVFQPNIPGYTQLCSGKMYFIWLILNPALLPVERIHISYLNTFKNEFSKKTNKQQTLKSQKSLNKMFQLWRGRDDEEQLCECFPPHPLLERV